MTENIQDILSEIMDRYGLEDPYTEETWIREQVQSFNEQPGNIDDGYHCDRCKDKGIVAYIDDAGKDVYTRCSCVMTRTAIHRARQSGLWHVLSSCTFDKYDDSEPWQRHIKELATEFIKDAGAKWFFIGGQSGCGKSMICTAIAGAYIKAGKDVRYMLWAEEAKRLKSIANDERYADEAAVFSGAEVLYIDDFLKVRHGEVPTNGDINLAFEIINHRLLTDGITIISSEKTLDQIIGYDEALASRIFQSAGKYKISIGQDRKKNYRLKGASA